MQCWGLYDALPLRKPANCASSLPSEYESLLVQYLQQALRYVFFTQMPSSNSQQREAVSLHSGRVHQVLPHAHTTQTAHAAAHRVISNIRLVIGRTAVQVHVPGLWCLLPHQTHAGTPSAQSQQRVEVCGVVQCRPSPHKCNVEGCGKVFAYRSGLLAHIKTVHDQKLPFHCHEKDCNMHFTSNAQLQEHYERVHRNQHTHTLLYDSGRLQPPMQSMPLPVLPLDINGSGQGQQIISSV